MGADAAHRLPSKLAAANIPAILKIPRQTGPFLIPLADFQVNCASRSTPALVQSNQMPALSLYVAHTSSTAAGRYLLGACAKCRKSLARNSLHAFGALGVVHGSGRGNAKAHGRFIIMAEFRRDVSGKQQE
jgi:hypothetical protein